MSQRLFPNPDLVWTQLDGESVLLDLRTRDSFTLNRPGSLGWTAFAAGRTVRAVHRALCRHFDVPARLAWSDLTALVLELRREGLLLDKQPAPAPPRRGKNPDRASGQLPAGPLARSRARPGSRTLAEPVPTSLPGLFALNALVLEKDGSSILVAAAGN